MMKKKLIMNTEKNHFGKQNHERPKPKGLAQDYLDPRGAANKTDGK
jgi:hypothetical protein